MQAVKQENALNARRQRFRTGQEKFISAQDVEQKCWCQSGKDEARAMGDEYVSVEHLMISLMENPNQHLKELFKLFDIQKNDFCRYSSSVRGNTVSPATIRRIPMMCLKNMDTTSVEDARNKKLDPVIGRDDEIRNVISDSVP